MLIRLANKDDAKQIAENNILLAKETENMDICYKDAFEGAIKVIEDINKGFYIVAEEDGIIGQLMVTYEWSDWRAKQIWWLQSIYVRKEYRKKGVMKMLIEKVKEMALKNNAIILRLYVYERNNSAIKAYERIGMRRMPYIIYEMKL